MKIRSLNGTVWVAVKVERGFVSEVRLFESAKKAQRIERRWRRSLNPDYDETGVLPARVPAAVLKTKVRCDR